MVINLLKYRGSSSTTFTDRQWGEEARIDLKLDELDITLGVIKITIPKGTTSFNTSFYLGLFFKSYQKLTIKGFQEKYIFVFEDLNNEDGFNEYLKEDLDDGQRQAKDEISNNYGV